jgi:3-hydroxybutyryl-CoA dehydrogenase
MAILQQVGVLGFGTMGAGIAQVCAQAGCEVTVLESDAAALRSGQARMEQFLAGGVARGKLTEDERAGTLTRVRGTLALDELAGAELVIEAIVEELSPKLALLERVSAVIGVEALIATNTSALAVTELATAVADPQRFAGLHFFNPAPVMQLVEVVVAEQTVPATVANLVAFARQIGKEPVVTKDRPGFLVNRLLMPYLNQAIQAHDDGIATGEDIDLAVQLGLGYPLGPLRVLDLIGLDVHAHATSAAHAQLFDEHFAPPPELMRLAAAGRTGRKAGRGFYDYEQEAKA